MPLLIWRRNPATSYQHWKGKKWENRGKKIPCRRVGMLGRAITDLVHSQAIEVPVHAQAREETKIEI